MEAGQARARAGLTLGAFAGTTEALAPRLALAGAPDLAALVPDLRRPVLFSPALPAPMDHQLRDTECDGKSQRGDEQAGKAGSQKLMIARIGRVLNGFSKSPLSLDDRITEIQRAMLQALAPAALGDARITRRIVQAEDIQTLWYLRADLMAALAWFHGEAQVMEMLRAISNRFHALLPGRFASRSSPLSHC